MMNGVEHIHAPLDDRDGIDGHLATVVRARAAWSDVRPPSSIDFHTHPSAVLQVATIRHPSGHVVEPHVHLPHTRTIRGTPEVIVIRAGKVGVDFYTCDQRYVTSRVLLPGDVVILLSGGHALQILEDAEMLEVKQGPYLGAEDKVRFQPVKEWVKASGG